jgi:hypothetical protein
MPYQTHHPKILMGHENGLEELDRYLRYGEAFSPHSYFDDEYVGMFDDKIYHGI